jgi:hypothetical protein
MPTPAGGLFSEPPSQQWSEIMMRNYPSNTLQKSDEAYTK